MIERVLGWRPLGRGILTSAIGAVPLLGCGGATQAATEPIRQASTQQVATEPIRQATTQQVASAATESVTAASAPGTTATTLEAVPVEADTRAGASFAAAAVPTECEPDREPCGAPARFVEQVCRGKYQDLALVMLSKGTPWRRGYLKVEKLEPVNLYDGERSEQWLVFGEEVLVLRTRGPGGRSGVQVSGPTNVNILRWDGTCATIRQEMLAQYPTNTSIATPRIAWKYLDSAIQEALLANSVVKRESEKERPACRASTMKNPDAACDKASRKLTDAITMSLRAGLALPTPTKLPTW